MKCPDCKIEMTATTAQGLQLLVPQHDEPGRRNIGKQPAQIVAHVCPKSARSSCACSRPAGSRRSVSPLILVGDF